MSGRKLAICFTATMMVASLLLSPSPASADTLKWSAYNIPTEGQASNWLLAAGSDVRYLTKSADGTLYCYANPTGSTYRLFKSVDEGKSWSASGGVTDSIIAIACPSSQPGMIAYATTSRVYLSRDGGNSFLLLPPNPGGAGSGNVEITSLAIFADSTKYIIAAGTRDTDAAQFGGVYVFEENVSFNWNNTTIGGYDVYAVAFSPDYARDLQLLAVATDETNTIVTSRVGNEVWSSRISNSVLNRDNAVPAVAVAVDTSASITFSVGYSASIENATFYIGIDAGAESGDVYRINSRSAPNASIATDLNIGAAFSANNVDINSVTANGSKIIAGAAGSAQVYVSADNGATWSRSTKPPTGQSRTFVLSSGNNIYASTSGTESAFSCSTDSGITWEQCGLIDTTLTAIVDLAVSPAYEKDGTLYLLTFGGKHSLWRSRDKGISWQRIFSSALAGVDSLSGIKLSPSGKVLFAAGQNSAKPAIWNSSDNGQTFNMWLTADPVSSVSFNIDTWQTAGDNDLFIGSYNGANGLVYHSSNRGLWYEPKVTCGTRSLNSIALSPDFTTDKTILVGNTFGEIWWSNNGGASFELLPAGTVPPFSGNVTVAFDPDFTHNRTVYAASDTAGKGIYRFVIGKSTVWESIDSTMPAASIINRILVTPTGVLYGSNAKAKAGMERSLNPTYYAGATFESISGGLENNSTLVGLWSSNGQIWTIDTTNKRLLTYEDTAAIQPKLTSPSNQASGLNIKNITLDWQAISGATKYHWQLSYSSDFSSIPTGFEGDTTASTVHPPVLEVATTYYWRVRVTEPALSNWSDKWSFTTTLGSGTSAPKLLIPEAGATGMALKPVLQWEAVPGASRYELLVAKDTSFTNPVIARNNDLALDTNAWQSNIALEPGTTYFWKVRGGNAQTYSEWSAVSAFVTLPAALPAPVISTKTEITSPVPVSTTLIYSTVIVPTTVTQPVNTSVEVSLPDEWSKWLVPLGVTLLAVLLAICLTLIILVRRMRQ